ncbi:MAG: bifunctional UDP-N-acetylglucosamine diphosphorylase/glucosamine-1-phosphate N-acetyltransferase GlmU [Deltaproteobacteria bacterium]|jgi:bifunctional UDP-N-acetylglucosamine pyrophosphorylase/glucosamine-1-phosphate N-acetyltransferase|nr:bifunctional UDP-N-acetylglucosamine diphosphorylase/glucosamine-1-phosphate N-acetyltransferase GlmU [Deltaproteobacteria bacterium]
MKKPADIRWGAVILAAGKGTRMRSARPKVMHELLGESMLRLLLDSLKPIFGKNVWIVLGHGAEEVRAGVGEADCSFVLQREQLGTGHALQSAWPLLEKAGLDGVLVVNGDVPLLDRETAENFMELSLREGGDLSFLSLTLEYPGSFGRVIRRGGEVRAVIEAGDYDLSLHGPESGEINAGIYFLRPDAVAPLLERLGNDNRSGEYYLTDLIALAAENGLRVLGLNAGDNPALLGVNSPLELARMEELLRERLVLKWQGRGALIRNPGAVRLGPGVELGAGAELTGPCEIYGKSRIAGGARIESHCWIKNSLVGENAFIRSFCHIEDASIGPGCLVGPFARLRPGAELEEEARIGNFVEMKKSRLGKGAKANHLSYLGDAEIGAGANIGAGTITCNYDGKRKHSTIVGKGARIGSNTSLVAPVKVGDAAVVGAGSVITENVPGGALALTRSAQVIRPDYARDDD